MTARPAAVAGAHLADPPEDGLEKFPVWRVHRGTLMHRVTSGDNGPWWFASDGQGRFDLDPPRGTCYLADDAVVAILECLREVSIVDAAWCERHRLWSLALPEQCNAADTTTRRARGFGVTAELATVVPYDRPRRWAAAFAAAGFNGIRYRVRHDPAGGRALALFGRAGERTRWKRGRAQSLDSALLARLTAEAGVTVAPVPSTGDLGDLLD